MKKIQKKTCGLAKDFVSIQRMATITFNVPDELDEQIGLAAQAQMLSKSALIRIVLASHVKETKAQAAAEEPNKEEDAK